MDFESNTLLKAQALPNEASCLDLKEIVASCYYNYSSRWCQGMDAGKGGLSFNWAVGWVYKNCNFHCFWDQITHVNEQTRLWGRGRQELCRAGGTCLTTMLLHFLSLELSFSRPLQSRSSVPSGLTQIAHYLVLYPQWYLSRSTTMSLCICWCVFCLLSSSVWNIVDLQ